MSDLTFKKFVDFVNLEGDVSDDQINEIFGLFRNNQKLDKLKKEREKLKGMSAQKKAELDQALKDFKDGKKPGSKPAPGTISDDDLEAALDARDRKFLSKQDAYRAKSQTGRAYEANIVALKVKVDLSKFPGMKASDIEDAIFGEDEGDESWVQNQTVTTVETVKLKDDILYVYPMYDHGDVSKELQSSYNRWQRSR